MLCRQYQLRQFEHFIYFLFALYFLPSARVVMLSLPSLGITQYIFFFLWPRDEYRSNFLPFPYRRERNRRSERTFNISCGGHWVGGDPKLLLKLSLNSWKWELQWTGVRWCGPLRSANYQVQCCCDHYSWHDGKANLEHWQSWEDPSRPVASH